jgi:hypothetical protein
MNSFSAGTSRCVCKTICIALTLTVPRLSRLYFALYFCRQPRRNADSNAVLIRFSRKHALTLQLHTAHILSAHASLEQKNKAIQDLKEQKNK